MAPLKVGGICSDCQCVLSLGAVSPRSLGYPLAISTRRRREEKEKGCTLRFIGVGRFGSQGRRMYGGDSWGARRSRARMIHCRLMQWSKDKKSTSSFAGQLQGCWR